MSKPDAPHKRTVHIRTLTKSTKNTRRKKFSHEIKACWSSSDRIYQLERILLPAIGAAARRRILEEVMENAGAIGMIEWWTHGILQKPWRDFEVILILKRRHKSLSGLRG